MVECSNCGKKVKASTIWDVPGWLHVSDRVFLTYGRGPRGDAQYVYAGEGSNFCSVECLTDNLNSLAEKIGLNANTVKDESHKEKVK